MILSSLPPTPANPALINSHSILERADEAAEALFTAFETVRRARNAKVPQLTMNKTFCARL